MPIMSFPITKFSGGISYSSKSGLPNSYKFAQNLDIYSDEDSATLNPGAVKDSGSTVTDLIKWFAITLPYDTNIYGYGDAGNIWQRTSGGSWSLLRSGATIGNGATGQGMEVLFDYLYYATSTTIGRYGLLDNTPTFNDDFFTDGSTNVDLSVTSMSGQTYTVPTSITENDATKKTPFTPNRDPLKTINIIPTVKGTGNWTVTVHDSANNPIGSATIVNASLTNTVVAAFTFATPLRVNPGQTYHFHVTSTVGDGTLQTGTSADQSTCYYTTIFGILIADTNFHPMRQWTNGVTGTLVTGNSNYIAEWTMSSYNPNRIVLEPGYTVRAFTQDDVYLVALAWRGTAVDGFQDGRAYYWDGIQNYYNFSRPITTGVPNAAEAFKNRVFTVLGFDGSLYLGTSPYRRIQRAPQLGSGNKIEVFPGAMDTWRNRLLIGYGVNSDDSTGLVQGVYEYANISDRAISFTNVSTEVLTLGYTISTGTTKGTSTNLKIGCVKGVGKDMYISWFDSTQTPQYGVDKVTKGGNPAATGIYESLIIDVGADKDGQFKQMPQKTKLGIAVVVTFATLPTGCTVTPKYKLDRGSWVLGTGNQIATAGATSCKLPMAAGSRYKEVEVGYNLTATVNYPTINAVTLIFDPLEEETSGP